MDNEFQKLANQRLVEVKYQFATTWYDKVLFWLAKQSWFEKTIIYTEGDPYLLRVYLYRGKLFPHLFLHYFFRGDMDRDLHDHPWKKSKSLILTRGYQEERLVREPSVNGEEIRFTVTKHLKPWTFNNLKKGDFHKVTLLYGKPWTLFFPGERTVDPREESWGFINVMSGKFTPWKQYIDERDYAKKKQAREEY